MKLKTKYLGSVNEETSQRNHQVKNMIMYHGNGSEIVMLFIIKSSFLVNQLEM
jgi:hypothetical protein